MYLRYSGYVWVATSSMKEKGNGLGVDTGVVETNPDLPECLAWYFGTPYRVIS